MNNLSSPQVPELAFDAKSLWQETCNQLKPQMSEAAFTTWIMANPLTSYDVVADNQAVGTITSPSAFHATSLQKNFQGLIERTLSNLTGVTTKLQIQVGTPKPASEPATTQSLQYQQPKQMPPKPKLSMFSPEATHSPRVEDLFSPQTIAKTAAGQAEFQARKAGLRPDYTFTTFAVSTTNEMAHAAATAVSNNPGGAYNPLFLYGGVGVGKTHLMHAIGNNILHRNPQATIQYLTGEEFTNQIVSAIQTKKAIQFKAKYRAADVMLIDDVQFIAGKNAVQEEFFHTFNALVQQHGQIVLTSDRPPHEINLLEDRLRSRFEAGLMIDIQQPTFELRTAILLIKAKAHSLEIPMDVAQIIASRVDSARRIEGVITKIRSEVELKGADIDQQLVDRLLASEQAENGQRRVRVKVNDVIKTVADHYRIKQAAIKGKSRVKQIALARHVAMYVLKSELNLPYAEIGRWFSNRDHTSAMHGVSKIEKYKNVNVQLNQDLDAIRTTLVAMSK